MSSEVKRTKRVAKRIETKRVAKEATFYFIFCTLVASPLVALIGLFLQLVRKIPTDMIPSICHKKCEGGNGS